MPGSQRLQYFSVAGKAIPGRTRSSQALLIERRRHHGGDGAIERLLGRPLHAAACKFTRYRTNLAIGHRKHGRTHLQHRDAARRYVQRLLRTADLQHRPGQTLGYQGAGAAHGLDVSRHESPLHRRCMRGIGLSNNFGANAGRIAHGDG